MERALKLGSSGSLLTNEIYFVFFFKFFFFLCEPFFKKSLFVIMLLLFYVLVFWLCGIWDLCSPTRELFDNQHPLHWKAKSLTTGLPGKPLKGTLNQEGPYYARLTVKLKLQPSFSFTNVYWASVLWQILCSCYRECSSINSSFNIIIVSAANSVISNVNFWV